MYVLRCLCIDMRGYKPSCVRLFMVVSKGGGKKVEVRREYIHCEETSEEFERTV